MTFTIHPLSRATRFSSSNAGALALRFESWRLKLAAADLAAVRKLAVAERSRFIRFCAILISKLGNGWIYPILAAVIFAQWGWSDGKRLVLLAGVNAASMHILYPLIKMRFKRLRPFKVDPSLPSLMKTLDEHSFPSGHAMTLTGVLAPIVLFAPGALISAVAMACCMAWSRIATGHHYPSDVAAGVALGVGLGYPLSANLAAYF
jgi:undecaprenyl-diphosphatase